RIRVAAVLFGTRSLRPIVGGAAFRACGYQASRTARKRGDPPSCVYGPAPSSAPTPPTWEVPMGYPKPTPSDNAPPLRMARPAAYQISLAARRFARRRPQPPQPMQHLSGADQLALARIAERFAPGIEPAPAPALETTAAPKASEPPLNRSLAPEVRQTAALVASLPRMRTLIGVLIGAALLPSLAFGAMVWLGALKTPWSAEGTGPSASPAAITPAPGPGQSKQVAALGPFALTSPDTLDATAGQEIPFDIALDHTGDLPARSSIAVAGLPHGAALSAGRPYGENEWNLRTDEIGDLNLILPTT